MRRRRPRMPGPDMVVTTWSGGAASWRESEWLPLAGREVILVADGDPLDKLRGCPPGMRP